jgi:probable DNA metabolism protein
MKHRVGFDLVTRHRDYDKRLHEKVLRQNPILVANCATAEAKRLYRMQREVSHSLHVKKGFLRLKQSPKGILYAQANLEHDVADLLLTHFHRRFPAHYIALEHRGKIFVAFPNGKTSAFNQKLPETIRTIEENLAEKTGPTTSHDESIWRQYYQSQMTKERRNLRLMDKMMPHKYRDKDAYENNAESLSHNLTEYCQSKP